MPERMSEYMPEQMQNRISDRMSKYMPERVSNRISQQIWGGDHSKKVILNRCHQGILDQEIKGIEEQSSLPGDTFRMLVMVCCSPSLRVAPNFFKSSSLTVLLSWGCT